MAPDHRFFGGQPRLFFDFKIMVLPDKLVDGQVAASNSDHDLILISFDINSL